MRLFFLLSILFSIAVNVCAQDPHFSQFFASPLTLNPAFTGKTTGTTRVAGNYRNQWPTINRAFQTSTLSVDLPIAKNSIAYNDTWGVGVMGYTDKSAAGAVNFNYGSISTAFHKGLDEDGYKQLGIGFQATYANMLINTSQIKFEDQLTTNGFTGITSEIFANNTLKTSYFDVNVGLLYTASTTDKNNFYAGVSVYHINQPRQQFTGGLYTLKPRSTFHAGGYFPVGQVMTMHVSGLYSAQAKATETVIGGALQLSPWDNNADKPTSIYVGSWIRLKDAIVPYIGLEVGDIRIGSSYDINTSSLKSASESRGGVEISLIYTRRPPDGKALPCPKF